MTIAGRRESRFSDITKVRNLGTKFYAMSGKRQTVIITQNNGGLAEVVAETPSLGSEARDVAYNSLVPTLLYVLTGTGVQLVDSSVTPPTLGTKLTCDVGDGRWILTTSTGGTPYIVTPVDRGIQVITLAGVRTSVSTQAAVESCLNAAIGTDDVVYVVDEKCAKIHVWRIIGPTAVYINSFKAKNCREVVQVVLDTTSNILFVQCKHRIVGFNVTAAGTADSDVSVTLRQDYGSLKAAYTDMVKIGTNKYWIGVDADSAFNAAPEFYGRTYAAWDTPNQVLFAAFPDMAIFAASNVTPYVGEAAIPDVPAIIVPPVVPVTPPPVVTPAAPVITSSLTASVTEDSVFNYVITATGTGPITYSLVSPPAWLTSINHVTGAISGIPPDPGTVNVTIRATNSGGTDTKILVITVNNAIGDLSAVRVNGQITDSWLDRVNYKLYIVGGGTLVTDASGAYARSEAACLDVRTGLWTTWAPTLSSASATIWSNPSTSWIYIGGGTAVNGAPGGQSMRVNKTTGASDATFSITDTGIDNVIESGSIWAGPYVSSTICAQVSSTGVADLVGTNPGVDRSLVVRASTNLMADAATACVPYAVTSGGDILAGHAGAIGVGPPYKSRGLARFAPASGQVYQSGVGPSTSAAVRVVKDILFGKLIVTAATLTSVQDMSGNVVQSGLNGVCVLTDTLSSAFPFGVTFTAAATSRCGAIDPDSSNVFIAGDITSVGGDAARKGVFKMDSAGNLVTGFNPVFSATATVATAAVINNVVFLMGLWGGTVNGQSRPHFVVVRTDTGALY